MAAQKGKDLLLKLDATASGTFTTVAGLRTRTLVFNAQTIDVTDQDSVGRWRELLGGAGVRHAQLTGSGLFKDAASDIAIRSSFFDGSILPWQIIIPTLGTISGLFMISSLHYSGKHDGEITFDITLESSAALAFTAA